ncbi:hypothetical protein PYW08_015573 [Mythimna loreyi]|uniref:Uncharacterized protein n=1 Tax=Mythimna loreyi TaxID=667449 RepID=A0ACC2QW88_9NEOP|nr:hypothetical protein PYW08_015573 [Mythimna loreyi]
MAPRSAKAKKAADVKVTENDAPKKGRGKGKVAQEPDLIADIEINEKTTPVADKKPKRGKKAASDSGEPQIDKTEEVPPTKKGRKKNADDSNSLDNQPSNGDQSGEEETPALAEENEQSDENAEANGHTEEAPASGRGRKKPAKKEPVAKKPESKSGRGRKAKQEAPESEETPKDEAEEKSKPAAKGRGRKAAKVEAEPEADKSDTTEEEIKEKPASRGRKRAPAKAQEKEVELDEDDDEKEDKPEPKKKEPRGRKNQGKKAQPKEDAEDDLDEDETPSSKKRKVTKKAETKNDDEDEDVPEEKPQESEPTSKRKRKGAAEKAPAEEPKKKAPAKNKSATDFESIDFSNSSRNSQGKEWNFKISSWNVDGIRAWATKGCLDYFKHEKPDILCVQETKCSQDKLPTEVANIPGYHAYWVAGEKDGYAGVGIYTTKLAMNVVYGLQNEELDSEGRIITAEYEQFYLVCTYVPNSGRKLVTLPKRLQWNEEFRRHVKELDKKKPVIICGDMNVSHKEIDLANPKTNRKNAGFTDEERAGMTELLGDGFIDTYRHLYPDKTGAYTFWTYMMNSRAKNVGWRLDYFIISERLLPALCDNVIRDSVYGSDHCPLSLFLHLSTADKPKE